MGKTFKVVASIALQIGAAIATQGQSVWIQIAAQAAAAAASATVLRVKPNLGRVGPAQANRLNATIDPSTPRKFAFGETAFATDIRYIEPSGAEQEYFDEVLCAASHKVASIDEIWLEDRLAWSAGAGVQAFYAGYLDVWTVPEAGPAAYATVNAGASWGAGTPMTGCALVHLRFKRTGVTKKAESPFAGSVPFRITVKGKGAPVYDPRRDSTVPGGLGPMRANDQTTWAFSDGADVLGENPALQILTYLLGWRIKNPVTLAWKLAVGVGIPPARIDLESFITAANLCDEPVTLAAGGTEPRYRAAGVYSEGEGRLATLSTMTNACRGTLRDAGGRLALSIAHNDLGGIPAERVFTDRDVLGAYDWEQTPSLEESYSIVRGRYVDASDNSLFQMVDYPAVSIASPDGIERVLPLDMPAVQSPSQAQRLAKMALQRSLYRGRFQAEFGVRAEAVDVGEVIKLTFSAVGFVEKLFRVLEQTLNDNGRIGMVLEEENAAIYAWDNDDSAAVQPAAPTVYNPLNAPLILAAGEAKDAADAAAELALDAQATADGKVNVFFSSTSPPAPDEGDLWKDTDDGLWYKRTGGVWVLQDSTVGAALEAAAEAQATADGKVVTFYSEATPTAEGLGDLWYKASTRELRRWDGDSWEPVSTHGSPPGSLVGVTPAEEVEADAALGAGFAIDVANDGVLDPSEKRQVVYNLTLEAYRYLELLSNGTAALGGGHSAVTAMTTAWNALNTYLNGLAPAYNDFSQGTAIVRATFIGKFEDYSEAAEALDRQIKLTSATTANWSGVGDDGGRPANYATRDLVLINHANTIISGNSTSANGGATGWTRSAYTSEVLSAGAVVSARVTSLNKAQIFGLVGAITTTSFTDIPFGFYVLNDQIFIVEDGVTVTGVGTATLSTLPQIVYDDVRVTYFVDGVKVRTVTTAANRSFRGKFCGFQEGAGFAAITFGKLLSLDFASQGGSTKPENNADVTANSPRVSKLGNDGRINDSRALRSTQIAGVRSVQNLFALSDADHNATHATINIAASTYDTDWGAVTYPSASFPASVTYGMTSYWWRNHDDMSSGTGTGYDASTSLADALGVGKIYLGGITARAAQGSGTGTGGTGGGTWCVDARAWVQMADGSEKRARDVRAGDWIMVLTADGVGLEPAQVEANSLGVNRCVSIRTEGGARLTVSMNTPLTVLGQRTGMALPLAANAWAYRLPVGDGAQIVWEGCREGFRFVGRRRVARITVHGRTYGASMRKGGRKIFTHNSEQKP